MTLYIARNGEKIGPMTIDQARTMVQNGTIAATDLAWYEGLPSWIPLNQVPGFALGVAGVPNVPGAQPERPVLVWVICLFYFICTPFSMISVLMVPTLMQMPQIQQSMPEMQRDYFASLGWLNYYGPAMFNMCLSLAWSIQLFRLKRNSIYIFVASLIFGVLDVLYSALTTAHYFEIVGIGGLFGLVFTWILLAALLFYNWWLIKKGALR